MKRNDDPRARLLAEHLGHHFARLGARLRVELADPADRRLRDRSYRLDLLEGRHQGEETFHLLVPAGGAAEPVVQHVAPAERALLLLVKLPAPGPGRAPEPPHRYLCGHDERAWFVAAIPRRRGVVTVDAARDALKPPQVLAAQFRARASRKQWHRRHNPAFLRQGEWFFLPAEGSVPAEALILRNEPIRRGDGKPHRVEELCRTGGVTVHVSREHPNGLTTDRYRELLRREPRFKQVRWQVMTRGAQVFARGRVSHPDHATLSLPGWHRVLANTEAEAPFALNLAFLD